MYEVHHWDGGDGRCVGHRRRFVGVGDRAVKDIEFFPDVFLTIIGSQSQGEADKKDTGY